MDDMMSTLTGRVIDADDLVILMAKASRSAVRHLPGVDWAGVTAAFGAPFTASHTNARVLMIDERQYGADDGPCLRAMRADAVMSMAAGEVAQRWPELGRTARAIGVHSYLAAPVHARLVPVGSINMYSHQPELPDVEPDLLQVIVDYVERGLDEYLDTHADHAPDQIRRAMAGAGRVQQAVGVMMSVYGFSADYARALLEEDARSGRRDLVDEATRIINGSSGAPA
jgi:hypothetical protein